MTDQHNKTELELAEEELRLAREQRDIEAIMVANKHIAAIRERIVVLRRTLARAINEHIHLLEVVDGARIQLMRSEQDLEDHEFHLNKIRDEIRSLGGRLPPVRMAESQASEAHKADE
jgi:chromosome segregation ATPase